jgi:predicted transcriptional regulator
VLSDADVAAITARLDRWDAVATPWTRDYLTMIGDDEAVRAPDLAARVGLDVPRFKRRVRQLKGLGLTISLDVGYRLSPRGRAYLLTLRPG